MQHYRQRYTRLIGIFSEKIQDKSASNTKSNSLPMHYLLVMNKMSRKVEFLRFRPAFLELHKYVRKALPLLPISALLLCPPLFLHNMQACCLAAAPIREGSLKNLVQLIKCLKHLQLSLGQDLTDNQMEDSSTSDW